MRCVASLLLLALLLAASPALAERQEPDLEEMFGDEITVGLQLLTAPLSCRPLSDEW